MGYSELSLFRTKIARFERVMDDLPILSVWHLLGFFEAAAAAEEDGKNHRFTLLGWSHCCQLLLKFRRNYEAILFCFLKKSPNHQCNVITCRNMKVQKELP